MSSEKQMSNIKTAKVRPDQLTKGDKIWNPLSRYWEPVQEAYWSEQMQRYVVYCGPLGEAMHTYAVGCMVEKQVCY